MYRPAELALQHPAGERASTATQHPGLIDANVRKLVGLHFHSVRKFGMKASTVHEWPTVQSEPNSRASKSESIKHHYVYNTKIYELY